MRIDELPELDGVLHSHLHGDHFDRVARRGLDRTVPVLTTPRGSATLRRVGFHRAAGLTTWSSHTIERDGRAVRVTAVPGRHARGPLGLLLPPVMGSVVDFLGPSGELELRVYTSGDTIMFDGLAEVARRFPDIDLVVVHLGGTRLPAGGLLPGPVVTMDGAQGVEFLRAVSARRAVPIHYDDYGVFASPLSEFSRLVDAAGLDTGISYLARGDTLVLTGRRQQAPRPVVERSR